MSSIRGYLAKRPLFTAVVYTGLGILPLFLVSAQILQLESDLGFGVASLGLAAAAYFGVAALSANPAGTVIKRIGPGQGLKVGTSFTVAACGVAALAPVGWLIPISMALGGVGNALIQVSANLAIFDGVSQGRQGLAFGAKQASVPLASVLAGVSLPVIGLIFGWRWSFVAAAALALAFALTAPEPRTRSKVRREELPMGRPPRSLLVLVLAGFLGATAGNSISLFIVPSAVDVGIGEGSAGVVLAVSSVLVVLVRVGAGWTVDRRASTGHIEMAVLVGAGALGALALMGTTSASAYLIAMPLALLGAWGWPGVFFFTVVNGYPEFPARASGIVISGNLTGTVIGPLVIGALAGAGRYDEAWLLVSLAAGLSALGFFVAYRVTSREVAIDR